jgi:uncharacterized membrane protein YhaH (DUF805 family)
METNSGEIDHHRPWIRDHRDDPGAMNWLETMANPFGESSKLHFSRFWTFSFMGRLLLYLIPSFTAGILGIAGVKVDFLNAPVNLGLLAVPMLLAPFAVFAFFTDLASFVAHMRRLADAQRPTWLAAIVLVPMILGLAAYTAGTAQGAAQHREMHAPKPAAAEAPKSADTAKKDEAKADEKKEPERKGPPQRQGPPQSERQMAISTGLGMGFPIWLLASFGVMLWTLTYVARLPNGGQGVLRTGSHLTPEEIEAGI